MKLLILIGSAFQDAALSECFEKLAFVSQKKGVEVFFSTLLDWDNNSSSFKNVKSFVDGKLVESKPVVPDMILKRSTSNLFQSIENKKEIEKRIPMLNPSVFEELCDNKYLTYLAFKDFCPQSFLINKGTIYQFKSFGEKIVSDKIIVKPLVDFGGKGIRIFSKDEVLKQDHFDANYIMQEFIDSSAGIENLVQGVHEVRITIIGKRISYAYIKSAAKDCLLCNVSMGSRMENIDIEKIPESIMQCVKAIMDRVSEFENLIYSADFAIDKQGRAKLIEMNSRPGLKFNKGDEAQQTKFYGEMVDNIIDYYNKVTS